MIFFEKVCYTKDTSVRIDFVLKNIFSYLLRNTYDFNVVNAVNKKEEYILNYIKRILDICRRSYGLSMKHYLEDMFKNKITEDDIDSVLLGVANEIFSDGITWNRITAFFIFVGELANLCINDLRLQTTVIDIMYESYSKLVKEKLLTWIEEHQGWEGILSVTTIEQKHLVTTSGMKTFLHTAIRAIGILSYAANAIKREF